MRVQQGASLFLFYIQGSGKGVCKRERSRNCASAARNPILPLPRLRSKCGRILNGAGGGAGWGYARHSRSSLSAPVYIHLSRYPVCKKETRMHLAAPALLPDAATKARIWRYSQSSVQGTPPKAVQFRGIFPIANTPGACHSAHKKPPSGGFFTSSIFRNTDTPFSRRGSAFPPPCHTRR